MPVGQERHVLPGDDRVDTRHRLCLGGVEARDVRMVHGSEAPRPQRAWDAHVVDERRPTGDVRHAVVARKPCSDQLPSFGDLQSRASSSACPLSPSGRSSPRRRRRRSRSSRTRYSGKHAPRATSRSTPGRRRRRARCARAPRAGCRACRSRTACRSGGRRPVGSGPAASGVPMPSSVVTSAPLTAATGMRHARRGSPSTSTVQAPQPPCRQPPSGS